MSPTPSEKDYVSLHTHSHNSKLDGFGSVYEYVQRTAELGQVGLGLSDHGNTAGIYDLVTRCRANGLTPVPGCEFYMAPENPEGARVKERVFYGPVDDNGRAKTRGDVAGNGAFLHQTMWAYNSAGLKNLQKLSTLSNKPENTYSKPRIDFAMLSEHSEGLIVATGCPSSEISTRFRLGQPKKALDYAYRLKEVFGDRLFVEIMDHNMSIDLERKLLKNQMVLSKKLGIPLLATNDSHYGLKQDAIHHEEMLASQVGKKMSDAPASEDDPKGRFAFDGDQYYLKSAAEMYSLFPHDEFPNAVMNSVRIAEMAQDLTIDFDAHLAPHAIVPEGYTPETYLKKKIDDGLREYLVGKTDEEAEAIRDRVNYEWGIIVPNGFASYMLVVAENINWTNERYAVKDSSGTVLALPTGPGRGSVGGCLIAYLIGISRTDPLRFDLIMERFLSDGRGHFFTTEFDNGLQVEKIASTKFTVKTQNGYRTRYAYELEPGDQVLLDSTDN